MTVETITASQTWVAPPGVTSTQIECEGAGGGGGRSSTTSRGGGGGGGAYAKKNTYTVVPGNSYTITVGPGGAGGVTGAQNGGVGTDSSFVDVATTICLAKGGSGGAQGGAGGGAAGAGGVTASSVGDVLTAGNPGVAGAGGAGAAPLGGAGGAEGNPGTAGTAPGGGGGGGTGGSPVRPGGAGARGVVVLTYTAAAVPGNPTGLVANPAQTSIQLDWSASTGSPTGYDVRIDGGAPTDVGNVLTHTFSGLTPNTAYTLEVRAYNANGDSGWTSLGSTTDPLVPPDAPTGLVATPAETEIQLDWTASTGAPTGYDVRIDGGLPTDVGNVLTHTFTGLTASTLYTLEVRAYNADGDSAYASTTSTTDAAPAAPSGDVRTLQYNMNRLAGTLDANGVPTLDAQGAANVWAGTTGRDLVGALNEKALNTLPNYKELQGVLNQLAGTSGLGVDGAASQIP
jgi:hypothetical protein